MKQIEIKVIVKDNKMASAFITKGYDKNSISDNLEILGILENLTDIHKSKLKKLGLKNE